MAFKRLENLGEEKFRKIINALMTGQACMTLAREIQTQWGDFQDVAEKSLTQQLNRLRLAAAEGMYGQEVANQIVTNNKPQIKQLQGISTNALSRMEELAHIQRQRVLEAREDERTGKKLQSKYNFMINDYSKLLQDLQKMRFDLGMDEFKGIVPGVKVTQATATILPDGTTNVHKQVFEAVNRMEEIFSEHKVPKVVEIDALALQEGN